MNTKITKTYVGKCSNKLCGLINKVSMTDFEFAFLDIVECSRCGCDIPKKEFRKE